MKTEIKSHYNYEEVIIWLEKKELNYTEIISKSLKMTIPLFSNSLRIS
ncbi:hypothetical protein [Flavobacterium sp. ZT3R18]|nr:hypothetical protein [Flavobacterium sp. ZT3R18]